MTYNGSEYFYLTNLQGDVTGLANASGATVVSYTYDSWGKLTSTTGSMATTLGEKNPYRYRGYRYDIETGLYYLQSRYYNPEIGRFINADDSTLMHVTQGELLGANLFAYCTNNPVTNGDPSGYWVQAVVGGIVSGLIAWGFYMLEYYLGMRNMNYAVMMGLITFNAAAGAAMWWLGFGGRLQRLSKLVGLAQKMGLNNTVVKGIALIPKSVKLFTNMITKSLTRKPGESWGVLLYQFGKQLLGVRK